MPLATPINIAAAFLIHIAVSSFSALLISLAAGRLSCGIAGLSLLLGSVAAMNTYTVFTNTECHANAVVETWWEKALYLFLAIVALRQFTYLFYYANHGWRTLDIHNFGDLPLHLTFIRNFAAGTAFWPKNPIYPLEFLRYPFGIDLYSALWESLGIHTQTHLAVLGGLSFAAALVLLHVWLGWWGVGAFFLNGGLANLAIFQSGKLLDYQSQLAWKNFFLTLFIPQRGFLWALPAGVFLLKTVFEVCYHKKELPKHTWLSLGFIWGIFPFFHLHSFLIISLLIGCWGVFTGRWRRLLPLFYMALPLAAGFILFSTDCFEKAGTIRFQWGWMAGDEIGAAFWWENTGLWTLTALWVIWEAVNGKLKSYRSYCFSAAGLFFIFTFVIMAPLGVGQSESDDLALFMPGFPF
jgi:hypothetical protein